MAFDCLLTPSVPNHPANSAPLNTTTQSRRIATTVYPSKVTTCPLRIDPMKRAAGRPLDLADIDELNLLHGRPSSYDSKS